MPVWFAEWSLASDNCALHLNGLNDGVPNKNFKCAQMECPKPYIPGAPDVDRNADILGPFGSAGDNNLNSIKKGKCWTDSLFYN